MAKSFKKVIIVMILPIFFLPIFYWARSKEIDELENYISSSY